MFSLNTLSCRPCSIFDPVSDTVKVDAAMLSSLGGGKDSVHVGLPEVAQRAQAEMREAERRQRETEERRQRELRLRRLEEDRARREVEEVARRQREEEVLRAQRERERREAEARERALLQAEAEEAERRRSEERTADELRVQLFLKAHGFAGLNVRRRKLLRSQYPLHAAVQQRDADMAARLLRVGADPSFRNSAGQTALELAQSLDRRGSHCAVVRALGGA